MLTGALIAVAGILVLWGLVAVLGDGSDGTADGTLAASVTTTTAATAEGSTTSAAPVTAAAGGPTTTRGGSPGATTTSRAPAGTVGATASTAVTVTVPATARRVPEGTWGGRGIRLVVGPNGGSVEYDCATGLISQPLVLNGDGSFQAEGSHAFQPGGPVQPGTPAPAAQAARYTGSVRGSQMELTVVLPQAGTTLGPFSLGLGQQPLLDRCG